MKEEALLAARFLQGAEIELLHMQSLLEAAVRMSIEIDHAACDCVYLALAIDNKCRFVTADERFCEKFIRSEQAPFVPRRSR